MPYEDDYTLIGTTDQPWTYAEGEAKISDDEIDYLCAAASEYFLKPVTREDIQWTYSGVRPLFDDHSRSAATVTRDFVFDYDNDNGAPVLSIFGGKITTYRVLALQAIRTLSDALDVDGDDWTKEAHLPGGDFRPDRFDSLVDQYEDRWPFIDRSILHRLARAYGTDTANILADVTSLADLGQSFGAGLYEIEIRWLIDREFACTAEDILWRRSKLGLHMNEGEQRAVEQWFERQGPLSKANLDLS
ncbi:FAD-dependent oxidoreductase [Sphingopyxis sp. BSNA05]|uniref:FAD-dependent oxidoreductase n=1 Tax=Sphingopyxis sp. BSNA05 TaxID=1236614 RepID=UPI00349F6E53